MAMTPRSVPSLKQRKVQDSQPDDRGLDKGLDEEALRYLGRNGATSVRELYETLRIEDPSLTKPEVADLVWRLAEQGKVDLEDAPLAARSVREYLGVWERNLWLYVSLAVSLATVLVVYATPSELPFVALRWVLGLAFALFIPGYLTVEALFPLGRELDLMERFALSVGLSLTLDMLVGLLLNYTPWGIRLTPILTSLIILAVLLAAIALTRQYNVSVERSGT
jgi:hypothetical protein